jgi:small neutral amino acid transporter SnatA (MarC family)
MDDVGLRTWWAICISAGSIFLTLVSIYLYADSRKSHRKNVRVHADVASLVKAFVFVWVLLGLLVFYIFSVNLGSLYVFAAGNIIVEAILIAYLFRNRTDRSEQT